ncbi:hypothetical protein [Streptomyces sp. NPDC058466]|uniref:hypothetical protein n=1 Tax=Streptomyces sp. NPDC058466 TaxID=3346512 RepID=UPI003657BA22
MLPEYLNSGFDEVHAQYGSFSAYEKQALGLDSKNSAPASASCSWDETPGLTPPDARRTDWLTTADHSIHSKVGTDHVPGAVVRGRGIPLIGSARSGLQL